MENMLQHCQARLDSCTLRTLQYVITEMLYLLDDSRDRKHMLHPPCRQTGEFIICKSYFHKILVQGTKQKQLAHPVTPR
jgi:hypothetical protein